MNMALLLTAWLLAVAAAAEAAVVPFTNSTKLRVCVSEFTPMVNCSGSYGGYEVELFRAVAAQIGWEEGQMEWSCMEYDDMLNSLKSGDGRCDVAPSGVEVTYADVAEGIQFSWPTYRNGLTIMTTTDGSASYGWFSFFDAFEWQVWVAAAATILIIPFVVYAIDWLAYAGHWPDGVDTRVVNLSSYFWASVGRPMWMSSWAPVSWAANVVVAVYAFLIMILFALYVGFAASNITTNLLDNQVTGLESLPGKAVGTWTDYTEKLQRRGVSAVGYPWDSMADEERMLSALKSGSVRALVLDASFLNYVAAADCDVQVVGATFDAFQTAVAFPRTMDNPALINAYNAALANLTAAGVVEAIAAETLVPADTPECGSGGSGSTSGVTFDQVTGLWILLAGAVGLAALIMAAHIAHVRWTRPVLQGLNTPLAQAKSVMHRAVASKMVTTPTLMHRAASRASA